MKADTLIVTPVFSTQKNKRLPLLLENIEYVKKQTHQNYRHLIIDDGSTDFTRKTLEKITKEDEHIITLTTENRGSSQAINLGIKAYFSLDETLICEEVLNKIVDDEIKFITIHHSDDLMTPKSIESRITNLKDAVMIHTGMIRFNQLNNNKAYMLPNLNSQEKCLKKLYYSNVINCPTMLWEKNFFMNVRMYDSTLNSAEDWDIALRSFKEAHENNLKINSLLEPTIYYRIHKNNLFRENLKNGLRWEAYKKIIGKHFKGIEYAKHFNGIMFSIIKAKIPAPIKERLYPFKNNIYHNNLLEGVNQYIN